MCGDGAGDGDGDSGGMGMGSDGTLGGGSASDNDGVEGGSSSGGFGGGSESDSTGDASADGGGDGSDGLGGFGGNNSNPGQVNSNISNFSNYGNLTSQHAAMLADQDADFGAFGIASTSNALGQMSDADFGAISDSLSDDPSTFANAMSLASKGNSALGMIGVPGIPGLGLMATLASIDPVNDQPGFSAEIGQALASVGSSNPNAADGQSDMGGSDDIPNAGAYIKEKLGLASNSSSGKGGNQNRDLARGQFGHPGLRDGTSPRNDLPDFTHPYIERTS